MKLNLLFVVLICLFQFSASAQIVDKYKSRPSATKPASTTPNVLTAQDKEKMERQKRKGISTEPALKRTPKSVQKTKPSITTGAAIQRDDAQFRRHSKPKATLSTQKVKTPAQEIADIEREIDRVSNSDDPEKVIRIQKMEKLLEKKKLEKFSKEQSN